MPYFQSPRFKRYNRGVKIRHILFMRKNKMFPVLENNVHKINEIIK